MKAIIAVDDGLVSRLCSGYIILLPPVPVLPGLPK